jgi:hypothetical protein
VDHSAVARGDDFDTGGVELLGVGFPFVAEDVVAGGLD